MTVTAGARPPPTAPGGALTLKAGIGEGNSGSEGGAVSIEGGLGANTGGAVSVTSGVGTADDSGSMTIATADSGSSSERRYDADNRDLDFWGDGGVYGWRDGHRNWRRGGCDLPERGGWQHRPAGR